MALRDISLNAEIPSKKAKLDESCEGDSGVKNQKRQLHSSNMATKETSVFPSNCNQATSNEDSVIILDDDPMMADLDISQDVVEVSVTTTESSKQASVQLSEQMVDEDIEITFSRPSETITYPHPRADCSLHSFTKTDDVNLGPVLGNVKFCENCFCYVCDFKAAECKEWDITSGAHCNAHRKADVWKSRRNSRKSGLILKLNIEEITQEVRDGAVRGQQLAAEVCREYVQYREIVSHVECGCKCHSYSYHGDCYECDCGQNDANHNFDSVLRVIIKAIDEARKEFLNNHATKALIILDEMVQLISIEKPPDQNSFRHDDPFRPYGMSAFYGRREVMTLIDDLLVDLFLQDKVDVCLRRKVITNMKLNLLKSLDSLKWEDYLSLTMRHWNDSLLSPVLHGQNITGKRGVDVLRENIGIAKKRLRILEEQKKWQHAARYVKLAQFTRGTGGLYGSSSSFDDPEIRERLPKYLIYIGKVDEALLKLAQESVGQATNKYKNSNSLLSRISDKNLLVLLKLFCGETPVDQSSSGIKPKILDDVHVFQLCLRAYAVNHCVCSSASVLEWIISKFLKSKVDEPGMETYKNYSAVSEMIIKSSRKSANPQIHVEVSILCQVRMLCMATVLADAISKENVTPVTGILNEFKPVFQKNPWVLKHFLNSASIQCKIESPAVYGLLKDEYITKHGLEGLHSHVIERVIVRQSMRSGCELLETVLAQASGGKQASEINYNAIPKITKDLVLWYAMGMARRIPSATFSEYGSSSVDLKAMSRFLNLILCLGPIHAKNDRDLLVSIAVRRFEAMPSVEDLEIVKSFSGTEWPKYSKQCLEAIDKVITDRHTQHTVNSMVLLDLYFKLNGHDRVYKLLESQRCRGVTSHVIAGKSTVPFTSVLTQYLTKISSLLEECTPTDARLFFSTAHPWLVNESYGPILCKLCENVCVGLIRLWEVVGKIDSSILVAVLTEAVQKMQQQMDWFYSVTAEHRAKIVIWLKHMKSVLEKCHRLQDFVTIVESIKNGPLKRRVALKKDLAAYFDNISIATSPHGAVNHGVATSQVESGDHIRTDTRENPSSLVLWDNGKQNDVKQESMTSETERKDSVQQNVHISVQSTDTQFQNRQLPTSNMLLGHSTTAPHPSTTTTLSQQTFVVPTEQLTNRTAVSSHQGGTPSHSMTQQMQLLPTRTPQQDQLLSPSNHHLQTSSSNSSLSNHHLQTHLRPSSSNHHLQNSQVSSTQSHPSPANTHPQMSSCFQTALPQNENNPGTVLYPRQPSPVVNQQINPSFHYPQQFQASLAAANHQLKNSTTKTMTMPFQVPVTTTNQRLQTPSTNTTWQFHHTLATANQRVQNSSASQMLQEAMTAAKQGVQLQSTNTIANQLFQRPLLAANQRLQTTSITNQQFQRPLFATNQQLYPPSCSNPQQFQQPLVAANQRLQNHSATAVRHMLYPPVTAAQQQKQNPPTTITHQTASSSVHQHPQMISALNHQMTNTTQLIQNPSANTLSPHNVSVTAAQQAQVPVQLHQYSIGGPQFTLRQSMPATNSLIRPGVHVTQSLPVSVPEQEIRLRIPDSISGLQPKSCSQVINTSRNTRQSNQNVRVLLPSESSSQLPVLHSVNLPVNSPGVNDSNLSVQSSSVNTTTKQQDTSSNAVKTQLEMFFKTQVQVGVRSDKQAIEDVVESDISNASTIVSSLPVADITHSSNTSTVSSQAITCTDTSTIQSYGKSNRKLTVSINRMSANTYSIMAPLLKPNSSNQGNSSTESKRLEQTKLHLPLKHPENVDEASTSQVLQCSVPDGPTTHFYANSSSEKKRKHDNENSQNACDKVKALNTDTMSCFSPSRNKHRKTNNANMTRTESVLKYFHPKKEQCPLTQKGASKDASCRQKGDAKIRHLQCNVPKTVKLPDSLSLDNYPVVSLRRVSPKTLKKYKVQK